MGITFDNELLIANYRPAIFKNGLRGLMRTESPGAMIDLKSVFAQRRDGAIVFEECLDRRLIELSDGSYKVSKRGEVIVRAKAKPRTLLGRAQLVLDEFLGRVQAMNDDKDAVRYAEQVWLFGSVLRGAETVGDIDLAVTTARRPQWEADYDAMRRYANRLVDVRPDAPTTRGMMWSAEHWLTERALFGTKRHPLLAGAQEGVSDLAGLGVPCRLIYDRSRGGKVDDPTLPRHPLSNGRENDIDPPPMMPDLTAAALRPMDGRWISGFKSYGEVSPYGIFRGWTDEAHRLFPQYPSGLRIASDSFEPFDFPWVPKRVKKGGLDGRSAIALISATNYWGTSIVLRRQIETGAKVLTLRVWFEDLELFRARKRIDVATIADLAAATALIVGVDAERMLRRSVELAARPQVEVRFQKSGEHDACGIIVDAAVRRLEDGDVRIQPTDWEGGAVSIVCQGEGGSGRD